MDKQPSEAAIYSETAQRIIAEWGEANGATVEGVGYLPPYNHLDYLITRALAERERAAYERVAEFSSVPPTTIPGWLKPGDVGYAYVMGWRDAHTDYRRAIRALMSEATPSLPTSKDHGDDFDADEAIEDEDGFPLF